MAFDHNEHYHDLLVREVPEGASRALDVGCGAGAFARRLAGLGLEVDAIDTVPMLDAARNMPESVRFRQLDITSADLPERHYDFISCLASIHHVPFATVTRLRRALAPGGRLVILGLYRESTLTDFLVSMAAVPANAVARLVTAGRPRTGRAVMPTTDPVMTLPEIRAAAADLLPGATIRRLLFWRYLLVYTEPRETSAG
ncbi:class I SAM-dependent methyltransferase [Nonomuraea fastidiosa]|jgi:2-polyprenyl-3-methyl-5-hydroxy-6-metoxy-1,4-benzoquinol methylase|uniref:class I SAM-dependent methyltransferase n=1 Tax=Nonomuraea TaxID=83681 RepID=UPI0032487C04